jgi:hypothetical protein
MDTLALSMGELFQDNASAVLAYNIVLNHLNVLFRIQKYAVLQSARQIIGASLPWPQSDSYVAVHFTMICTVTMLVIARCLDAHPIRNVNEKIDAQCMHVSAEHVHHRII